MPCRSVRLATIIAVTILMCSCSTTNAASLDKLPNIDILRAIEAHLRQHPTLQHRVPHSALQVAWHRSDRGGNHHIAYHHYHDGLRIADSYLVAHTSRDGRVYYVTSNLRAMPDELSLPGSTAFTDSHLLARATEAMDVSTRAIDVSERVWIEQGGEWIPVLRGRFQSHRARHNIRTIAISLRNGAVVTNTEATRHYTPFTTDECTPTTFTWANIFADDEPMVTTNVCAESGKPGAFALQSASPNIVTYAPATKQPWTYTNKAVQSIDYANFQLFSLKTSEGMLLHTFYQGLVAHHLGVELLTLVANEFKVDSYDGKGGQLRLLPHFFSPGTYPAGAYTDGMGYIYFSQPHQSTNIQGTPIANTPALDMVVLAHEFFHNFSGHHNVGKYCHQMEEGLATAFGYTIDAILSARPKSWNAPVAGNDLIPTSDIVDTDCAHPNTFSAPIILFIKLIEEGLRDTCPPGTSQILTQGCPYLVRPIGPYKAATLLFHLVAHYTSDTYSTFAEGLYLSCTDNIGQPSGNNTTIVSSDCDQIAKLLTLTEFSSPVVPSIAVQPATILQAIELQLTDLTYNHTELIHNGERQLQVTATIHNHSSAAWHDDLKLSMYGGGPYLISRTLNNLFIAPQSTVKIPLKIRSTILQKAIPKTHTFYIEPRHTLYEYLPGPQHEPAKVILAADDIFSATIDSVTSVPIQNSTGLTYSVVVTITNNSFLPQSSHSPLFIRHHEETKVAMVEGESAGTPLPIDTVAPGTSYSRTITFVGVPSTIATLRMAPSIQKLYEPGDNEVVLATLTLPPLPSPPLLDTSHDPNLKDILQQKLPTNTPRHTPWLNRRTWHH